jgi:hypothetical protein
MGCEAFEIGIRQRSSARMLQRTWTAQLVLESLPWLKRMNALGNDVYVRPAERSRHGLILVDDLSPPALARLERDGRAAAAVVETSPGSFQAWVRVPDRASGAARGEVARRFAREYEADGGSAVDRHYGRLAGFTNQKEIHRSRDGLQPFALLRGASGREAPGGELLLQQAERALRSRARSQAPGPSLGWAPTRRPTPEAEREATELFRERFTDLHRTVPDRSRCDFGAALHLIERGYPRRTIETAMRAASPDLGARKPGHVRDYICRTIDAAFRSQFRERDETERRLAALGAARRPDTRETAREATDWCRRALERSAHVPADPALRDLALASRLAVAGYSGRTIERALRAASPNLEERSRGQVERYVRATADLALGGLARQLERDRDRGRDEGLER